MRYIYIYLGILQSTILDIANALVPWTDSYLYLCNACFLNTCPNAKNI